MRNHRTAAAALGLLLIAGCAPEMTVGPGPTPTPTPSPTASPSPSAGASPTPTGVAPRPSATRTADSATPAPSPAEPSPGPEPTPTPTRSAPVATSAWVDGDSQAESADEVAGLSGVPDSFRTYAAALLAGPDADGCTTAYLSVMSVHPDGFILGSEGGDCGGGQTIWALRGGTWVRAIMIQAEPLCSDLVSAGIPAGAGLLCSEGDDSRTY